MDGATYTSRFLTHTYGICGLLDTYITLDGIIIWTIEAWA
jgi:hypothetical protein